MLEENLKRNSVYSKSTEMISRKINVYSKREKWVSQTCHNLIYCFEIKKVTAGSVSSGVH